MSENIISPISTKGWVHCTITYADGRKEEKIINNTVLQTGKIAIAQSLANEQNDPFDFYIDQMVFGTNGSVDGVPKFVDDSRNGLFGPILLSKNVIASIDPSAPTTANFTSVVAFSEGVGSVLSEMALVMASGDFYSMITFPDLTKTSSMQLTFVWSIAIL